MYRSIAFSLLIVAVAVALVSAAPRKSRITRSASAMAAATVSSPFTAVGSMSVTRFFHTATLLGNGRVLIAGGVTTTGPTDTAELFDPSTGTFLMLANKMTTPRWQHTATMLPSGRVLIAGGATGSAVTDTAELFDPATNTFTPLPNLMRARRDNHTATLLPNGKVLFLGGFNGSSHNNTAEIFDPATQIFAALSNKTMTSARSDHTATLLPSGKILITGGYNGGTYLDSAEICDPVAGTFTALPAMASVRDRHTATLLPNGKVLVAGGYTGNLSVTTDTAELFDPATNTFTATAPMSAPRQFHSATLLASGKVLVAGGSDGVLPTDTADIFDPATNTFMSILPNRMAMARDVHTATLLPNGQVLLAGGNTAGLPQNTASAEVFDAGGTASFTSTSLLHAARFFPTATLLPDGKVLIAGGQTAGPPLNTVEIFDPATATFSSPPNSMNTNRFRHSATLLPDGKVLLTGGDTSADGTGATDAAELFDPTTQTFTQLPPMTSRRWSHTATLLPNGKVLIAGGLATTDYQPTNTAELFDPDKNTFTAVAPMNARRYFHTATLLADGSVLIAGGFDPVIGGLDSAELFHPATSTFTLVPNAMTTKRYYHSATLLPNGQVLLAGGGGSAPPVFSGSVISNTAELFDANTNTFTPVPNNMNAYRYWQTATLLNDGKVLLAGGSSAAYAGQPYTMTADLYDPISKTFTLLPIMNAVRFGHTATLLPNGKVLVAAGTTGSTATNTAEIFDEGLGFTDERRPAISTAPMSILQSAAISLTGIKFCGDSEGSFGSVQSSATNYPLLELRKIDNDQSFFILSDPNTNWSDTSFTSAALKDFPVGLYRLTIFANAVPSQSRVVSINPVRLQIVSIARLTNGHVLLQCLGVPNRINRIEATNNLANAFAPLNNSAVADAAGAFQFEDNDSGNFAQRFYRLAAPSP